MKKIALKIVAVLMTFVVLFSTMSFSVAMHYCGDTLVDWAIFKDAEGCGMEAQQTSGLSGCSLMKKNCCSNEKMVTAGQDELKTPADQLTFQQQFFTVSFIYTYVHLFGVLEEHIVPYKGHPPPLLVRDIHILNQTFLI